MEENTIETDIQINNSKEENIKENDINENEINSKILKIEQYDLALDYYSKNNPFTNLLVASGIGLVGSYSTSVIAASLSSTIVIWGHVFFTDTAFIVSNAASLATGIFGAISIPLLIGTVSYQIYKYITSKNLKEYMEQLSDLKNDSMKEEREIYLVIYEKFRQYFQTKFKEKYTEIKNQIIKYSKKIIGQIHLVKQNLKNTELKKDIECIKNILINRPIKLNVLILGTTGVGKSTLINEFLKLKGNRADEGKSSIPMKIDIWPKKYPIHENDTHIQNIFLYDTEGIEKTSKDNNDIESHFSKNKRFPFK